MKKRLLSILLVLIMALSVLPTAAFAEDGGENLPACICETACTVEEVNEGCPVCGAEGAQLPPVYIYAVETAIQMTLTELNENLREIYIEAYTEKEASEYILRETAKELHGIFGSYLPDATERDFYDMEIGSASIMRGYMAHP